MTFKQDGEKLTGTYSSQMLGEQPLTGTIKGNDITFGFQASFDGNAVKVTYTGNGRERHDEGDGHLRRPGRGDVHGKEEVAWLHAGFAMQSVNVLLYKAVIRS